MLKTKHFKVTIMIIAKQTFLISIIIPVYNDPIRIKKLLNTLIDQTYPKEKYEIIVVDNNSTDNTLNIIKEVANNNNTKIKVLSENNIQTSYAARNKGIKNAEGELIIFLDSDTFVNNSLLQLVESKYKKDKFSYAGLNVIIVSETNNIFDKYDKLNAFNIMLFVKNRHFAPTCSLVVKKSIFKKIGFFRSDLISGGDVEFGQRAYDYGIKQTYYNDIIVYHPARSSFKEFYKKHLRIGIGKAYTCEGIQKILFLKYILPGGPSAFKRNNIEKSINYTNIKEKDIFIAYLTDYLRRIITLYSFCKEIINAHIKKLKKRKSLLLISIISMNYTKKIKCKSSRIKRKLFAKIYKFNQKKELSRINNEDNPILKSFANVINLVLTNKVDDKEKEMIYKIEELRNVLNHSTSAISITDYGAGSSDKNLTKEEMYKGKNEIKSVGKFCQSVSKSYKWNLFFI